MYVQLNESGEYERTLPAGNHEFSATVYQTAESLTDDQKAQFRVFAVDDLLPPLQPDCEYVEEWTYQLQGSKVVRTKGQRPIPQADREQRLAAHEEALWRAADAYQARYISGVAIGLLTIGVLQGKPKALDIQGWSASVWDEYYRRKAQLRHDSVVDVDFTKCGPMPHSVPELRAELGI